MALIQTPAIILGSISLGEADKLVTLLTLQQGKLTAAAKGSRRLKSRFGSSLEPFTYCQAFLFQKNRDALARLQQTTILHSYQPLREDLEHIRQASRMVSLTRALSPEGQANEALFSLLLFAFDHLAKGEGELIPRFFEIRLLKVLGYQPRLEDNQCLNCRKALTGSVLCLSPASGGVVCQGCSLREGPVALLIKRGTLAFWRQATQMPAALLFRLRATPAMQAELKAHLEIYLDYLLSQLSGRRNAAARSHK